MLERSERVNSGRSTFKYVHESDIQQYHKNITFIMFVFLEKRIVFNTKVHMNFSVMI